MNNPNSNIARQTEIRKQLEGDKIKGIFDSLNAIAEQEVTTIPEALFVNTYLPFFAGQSVADEINLSTWAGIAGNPFKSVNIADNNGVILYKIPPLFDRTALDPTKITKGASPIQHVMQTYEQLLNIHPVRAQNYLETELNKRNLSILVPKSVLNNLEIWNNIFKRYNLPLISDILETTSGVSKTPSTDLDYSDGIM